jgi:putative Mn2+ efflux pump MntP
LLAVVIVAPLLGLDNFAAAMGVQVRSVAVLVKVTLAFVVGAAVASTAGLMVGHSSAAALGSWGRYTAGGLLCLLGLYELSATLRGPGSTKSFAASWPTLILMSLVVSLDTVAAGFALGLNGAPVYASVLAITIATGVMTAAGVELSSQVRKRFVQRGSLLVGAGILAVGLGLLSHVL